MGRIQKFTQVLDLREELKRITQLSWELTTLERKFPLEKLKDDELDELYYAYTRFIYKVEKMLNKLKEVEGENKDSQN